MAAGTGVDWGVVKSRPPGVIVLPCPLYEGRQKTDFTTEAQRAPRQQRLRRQQESEDKCMPAFFSPVFLSCVSCLSLCSLCLWGEISSVDRARLDVPDLLGVLADGPVAGERSRGGDVADRLAEPGVWVAVQLAHLLVRLRVGGQVGQVHVVVALRQQRVVDRGEDAALVAV